LCKGLPDQQYGALKAMEAVLSIAMIAIGLLVWGGIKQMRNPADRTRGWLMLVAALVLAGNVAILTWP
jgi:hypothetical protein